MANVEKLIGLYSEAEGFCVGKSLTWADLNIFHLTSAVYDHVPDWKARFPKMAAVYANVCTNERVQAYVTNRPKTHYSYFSSPDDTPQ